MVSQRPAYILVLGILNCLLGCVLLVLVGSAFFQMVQFHGTAALHSKGREFVNTLAQEFPNYAPIFFAIHALLLAAVIGLIVSGFGILEMRRRHRIVAIVCGVAVVVLALGSYWFDSQFTSAVLRTAHELEVRDNAVLGAATVGLAADWSLGPEARLVTAGLMKTAPRIDPAAFSRETQPSLILRTMMLCFYPLGQAIMMGLPGTASAFRRSRKEDATVSELPISK